MKRPPCGVVQPGLKSVILVGNLRLGLQVRCNAKNLSAQSGVKTVTLNVCPRMSSDAFEFLDAP